MADRPRIRALLRHRRVEPVVAVLLRSKAVRRSPIFVLRELGGVKSARTYTLRDGDFDVVIRHGTPDVATLDEVFYSHEYAFPAPVREALAQLGRPPAVVDVGANIGLFGLWMLRHFPNAEITAIEPDPYNLEVLRRCVALNDRSGSWRVVPAAAGTADGEASFDVGGVSLSRLEPEGGNATVPVVDAFPFLERADLIKIDIEGGEWPLLQDPRFADLRPSAIVLEYHPHLAPADDPAEAAREFVAGTGLRVELASQYGPGQGMLWGWRAE